MSETTPNKKRSRKNSSEKVDPARQPFGWYARFAHPHPLPEVAPSTSKPAGERELRERLTALQKDHTREQRRGARLFHQVQLEVRGSNHRPTEVVGNWLRDYLDTPLDELTFSPAVSSQRNAGRLAVEHVNCLTRQLEIHEKIQAINSTVNTEG